MRHHNVLIATPGRHFDPAYIESLVATMRYLSERGITYKWLNKMSSFVPSARELTALDEYQNNWETREVGAGKFTYDKIFWIDSDVSWELEDFMTLYESDYDIVSGLYQTHPNGTVAVAKADNFGRPTQVNQTDFWLDIEPVEVLGVGFGFVCVKQGVFEEMDRPWFKIEQVQWDGLPFTCNVGEDYSWCLNAKRNGFRVMVDPTIKVKHHKEIIYELR